MQVLLGDEGSVLPDFSAEPHEKIEQFELDYDGKRERWNGYDASYVYVVERYEARDEARKKYLKEQQLKYVGDDERPSEMAGDARVPIPSHPPNGSATSSSAPPSSTAAPRSQNQTVVVQNPMSVDESGKLVGFSPLLQLLFHTLVDNGSVGERIIVKVGEIEVVHIGVALAEPVVAEPGRGADEVPPLVGEVLHCAIRRRHEDRSVGLSVEVTIFGIEEYVLREKRRF
nr:pre-mRNA-splicing factor SLU7 [Ipomoea batatas]